MSVNQKDYSKVILTSEEQMLFDKFKYSDEIILSLNDFRVLRNKGLIKSSIDGRSDYFDDLPSQGVCTISDFGKNFRAYQALEQMKNKKENRKFLITTMIAGIAVILAAGSLIVSIIALLQ